MIEPDIPSVEKTIVGERNEWLDCLRGYAVIIVCISHFFYLPPIKAAWPAATNFFKGDIGVWLFFVLSGFLIGGLLLKEQQRTGGVHLGRFYGRRLSRLMPSYLLFVLVMALVGSKAIRLSGVPWWAFFVPWLDMTGGLGYLPYHLRTLHIEEKFYMAWGMLAKFASRRLLLVVAIGLLIYGPVARVLVFLPGGPRTLMFDSAADCFGIGILLAFIGFEPLRSWPWVARILQWSLFRPAGLLSMMLIVGALRTVKPFSYPLVPFLPTVVGFLSACLLISGWHRRSAMQARWLSKVGLASYTIYLFQQLVLCPWNDIYSWQFTWGRWLASVSCIVIFVLFWFPWVEARVTVWGRKKYSHS